MPRYPFWDSGQRVAGAVRRFLAVNVVPPFRVADAFGDSSKEKS